MRLETGVFQPSDDWPGIFIRGDNALMLYLPAVHTAIKMMQESCAPSFHKDMTLVQLENLAKLLASCDASLPQTGNVLTISGSQWQR